MADPTVFDGAVSDRGAGRYHRRTCSSGMFISSSDLFATYSSTSQTIASALKGSTTDTFWVGSSYLLTSAIFQPFIVALSDDFGRRSLLFLSAVSFTIGTLICCLSNDFTQLLAGRAVQGIGGGGIMALNNVIITDIIPLRHRPMYIAIPQIAWAVGTITGPLLGGLFAEHTTWRWVFYINFPFCAIGLALVPFTVRLYAERPSVKERLMRLDWGGMALFLSSTTAFLIGITWGGSQYAWNSWQTLGPIILGLFGMVLTGLWERFVTSRPFLKLSLFKNPSANAAYFGALLQGLLVRLP
jgi:MFS family permease